MLACPAVSESWPNVKAVVVAFQVLPAWVPQVLMAAALVPAEAGPAVAHRQEGGPGARKGGGPGLGARVGRERAAPWAVPELVPPLECSPLGPNLVSTPYPPGRPGTAHTHTGGWHGVAAPVRPGDPICAGGRAS